MENQRKNENSMKIIKNKENNMQTYKKSRELHENPRNFLEILKKSRCSLHVERSVLHVERSVLHVERSVLHPPRAGRTLRVRSKSMKNQWKIKTIIENE